VGDKDDGGRGAGAFPVVIPLPEAFLDVCARCRAMRSWCARRLAASGSGRKHSVGHAVVSRSTSRPASIVGKPGRLLELDNKQNS
jgi:hypothetical protein